MKVFMEPQLIEKKGKFYLQVTLSRDEFYWTSKPAELNAATWEDARIEAYEQVKAMASALSIPFTRKYIQSAPPLSF